MLNPNSVSKSRCVDIVFAIDGTGSMSPCIESIKANARRFYTDFVVAISSLGSTVDMLRIKLIVFRDYKSDGDKAMVESPFFELPDEDDEFSAYLDGIRATGGCNEDANGLEALYYAMKSDFCTGVNDRQIIVMFADTSAIPLRKRAGCQNYPADMVDESKLQEMWMCLGQGAAATKLRERNKRLVIFAPEETAYGDIATKFNRSIFQPVKIHKGMDEISFDSIIKLIAASATNV